MLNNIVVKFGGTSLGSIQGINNAFEIISSISKNNNAILIVSACGNTTDMLINAMKYAQSHDIKYKTTLENLRDYHLYLISNLFKSKNKISTSYFQDSREYIYSCIDELESIMNDIYQKDISLNCNLSLVDKILGMGEIISYKMLYYFFKSNDLNITYKNTCDIIKTDSNHTSANVQTDKSNNLIYDFFVNNKYKVTILPGFIASDDNGMLTTIGRGGSDYTASIISNALSVKEMHIWTDVNGIYSSDPNQFYFANKIDHITYKQAIALASVGAKVIYLPSLIHSMASNILITINNTFNRNSSGTIISNEDINCDQYQLNCMHFIDRLIVISIENIGNDINFYDNNIDNIISIVSKEHALRILSNSYIENNIYIYAVYSNIESFTNDMFDKLLIESKLNSIGIIDVTYSKAVAFIGKNLDDNISNISNDIQKIIDNISIDNANYLYKMVKSSDSMYIYPVCYKFNEEIYEKVFYALFQDARYYDVNSNVNSYKISDNNLSKKNTL